MHSCFAKSEASVRLILMFKSASIEPTFGQACESVSYDSLFAALELRALETLSVRLATVPD